MSVLYTGPFHAALRHAIRERGLPLDRLRAHLARRGVTVGLSSLSDWQTGHSRPARPGSWRALRALEDVLELPPTSLIRLLDNVTGPRTGVRDVGAIAELLDTVPGSRDRNVELVSLHHKVVVDVEGRATAVWTRAAVRALRDGVDRYVARYYGDPDGDPALVRALPLGNCRLGRFAAHSSTPAVLYELLFDQTLRAGDSWVFETKLVDPNPGGCTEFAYGVRHPTEQCVLEVQFQPGAVPARAYSFAQLDLGDDRHPIRDLAVSKHHTVHLIASAMSSGVLGIKWDWQ